MSEILDTFNDFLTSLLVIVSDSHHDAYLHGYRAAYREMDTTIHKRLKEA